ncbi:MAG: glutamine-hydrolyzing carbamoyl-phosphate synthase small subunit [Flavobacteriales bacterium]|nr:glutamine-hydrolyzing carbamoyl-phosphate synthase small subunit [Flavobacteriales bacterium]
MTRDNIPAVLLLADGTVFHGKSCGVVGTATGEIAFNTAMTGYQEVFTDPSYYGQVLVMATAHIGNYGVHKDEIESDSCKVSGIIIKKFSDIASRAGASGSLQDFLVRDHIAGICDIDTRALVRHIRKAGAMNCIISSDDLDIPSLQKKLAAVPSMDGLELSSKVACTKAYEFGDPQAAHRVSVLDFGVKQNILRCLADRGCYLKVFPLSSTKEEILAFNPDGIMYSNGPGDPSAMPNTIQLIRELVETGIPGFGICLGHQLIGLSQGLQTEKMFNGHRGINHPVKNIITGKSEITSQNHGFVISHDSVKNNKDIEVTHLHLNDGTIAGIRLAKKPVFSVQYHPEASAGPHDSRYLFDQFVENMIKAKTGKLQPQE